MSIKRPLLSLVVVLITIVSSQIAIATSPSYSPLEQQALTDAIGKPVGGYFYTAEKDQRLGPDSHNFTDSDRILFGERLLWLPWGVVKVNIGGSENDIVFLKGYDSFKLNCSDDGNIFGVCLTGSNADAAMLRAVDYKIINGQAVLAGKPATLSSVGAYQAPLTASDVTTNDLSNGYTGIFYQNDEGNGGVSSVGDTIYLLQNGVISDGGRIPLSGNNTGAVDPNGHNGYSYTSTMTFADAGPGFPNSIIVTFKGTAPSGATMKVVPLNKTAVYSDNIGSGYSGFSPDGL